MRPSTLSAASLLYFTPSLVSAFPRITVPVAGASIPVGPITVEWEDNGEAPSTGALESYTLTLFVGGNEGGTYKPLTGFGGDISSGENEWNIAPGLSDTVRNGFFFEMLCLASDGGTVSVFSDRFTITGMTGELEPEYANAAEGLGTTGPENVNNVANAGVEEPAGDDGPPASLFEIQFGEQTGLTRYAPMQPIAPTKITKKEASRMHPTSSYDVAKTFLPPASIQTTVTQKQTNTVKSIENTVPPVASPSNDLAKFMARWKD